MARGSVLPSRIIWRRSSQYLCTGAWPLPMKRMPRSIKEPMLKWLVCLCGGWVSTGVGWYGTVRYIWSIFGLWKGGKDRARRRGRARGQRIKGQKVRRRGK